MPLCFWARCFLPMSVCALSQGKRPPCTSRLMWEAFTCTRTKDGTPWLDTQTSRKVFSSFSPLYWVFAGWLLIILIIIFFFVCLFVLIVCVPAARGLPTDRPMWSDESGLKECTKGSTHPPSPQWSWVGVRQKVWDQMEKPQKKTWN